MIADGVETDAQLAFLRNRQCDEAQGYHCSRPAPAEDGERILLVPALTAAFATTIRSPRASNDPHRRWSCRFAW